MITFSREKVQTVRENFHLVVQHWNEVLFDKRKGELPDPDWDYFEKLERDDALITFIAREDGTVIGYSLFILHPYLHNRTKRIAVNDAVFLRKDKRGTGAGARLLQFCDSELENLGIQIVMWHVKPEVDFSGTLTKLGYVLNELVYMKIFGG